MNKYILPTIIILDSQKRKNQPKAFSKISKRHVWYHKNTFKRRIATRIGKENQPLNIKTAVERPILKLGLPNFRWSFYLILLIPPF